MTIEIISLDEILEDDSLQIRDGVDSSLVHTYQNLMKSNGQLGTLDVFPVGSGKYLLANGWHRLKAADELGWPEIDCNVRKGGRREAVLFAAGANAKHGRPFNREEKRRAVRTLFADDEYFNWSDARIARHCGVVRTTVGTYRDVYINEQGQKNASKAAGSSVSLSKLDSEKPRQRIDKHGRESTISTTNIGRKPQTQAEKNLADLNGALDTLARLPFGGQDAVDLYGARITDKADAAIEFATDLGQAKQRAEPTDARRSA